MRIFNAILSVIMVTLISGACDKIEEPFVKLGEHQIDTTLVSDTGGNETPVRIILIEDYTGHKCPNCPFAAEKAHELLTAYGNQLVVASFHASGWYSMPDGNPPFSYNFETPEGNSLKSYYALSQFPIGMVNRTPYNSTLLLGYNDWQAAVDEIIDLPPDIYITLTNNFTASTGNIQTSVKTKFLNDLTGDFYLCAFVTEDSIVKPQKKGNEVIQDYVHMHAIRGSFNGTWGDQIALGDVTAGTQANSNYSLATGSDWVPGHLYIIAFVYLAENNQVIQAQKKKLVP